MIQKMMRKINEIIVHCTATPEGKDVKASDIRRFHVEGKGWRDIGYHYVVDLDGRVEPGRDESIAGAHCKGHNRNSIGVAYVGGVAKDGKTPMDTRTEVQKRSLIELLKSLLEKFPGAKIYSHREFANKACPSFDATREYSGLCKTVILFFLLNVCSACGARKTGITSQTAEYAETTESMTVNESESDSDVSSILLSADSVVITAVKDSVPLRIVAHRPQKEVKRSCNRFVQTVIKSDVNDVKTVKSKDVVTKEKSVLPWLILPIFCLVSVIYIIRKCSS